MKWYQPYNLSIPLLIIVGCIVFGAIQGAQRAREIVAARPASVESPDQLRADLQGKFIMGSLLFGGPFALVLFFALMPLNRKFRIRRSQNKPMDSDA